MVYFANTNAEDGSLCNDPFYLPRMIVITETCIFLFRKENTLQINFYLIFTAQVPSDLHPYVTSRDFIFAACLDRPVPNSHSH